MVGLCLHYGDEIKAEKAYLVITFLSEVHLEIVCVIRLVFKVSRACFSAPSGHLRSSLSLFNLFTLASIIKLDNVVSL